MTFDGLYNKLVTSGETFENLHILVADGESEGHSTLDVNGNFLSLFLERRCQCAK
jgi:hypothetical protein